MRHASTVWNVGSTISSSHDNGISESRYMKLNVYAMRDTAGQDGDSREEEDGDEDQLKEDSYDERCMLQQLNDNDDDNIFTVWFPYTVGFFDGIYVWFLHMFCVCDGLYNICVLQLSAMAAELSHPIISTTTSFSEYRGTLLWTISCSTSRAHVPSALMYCVVHSDAAWIVVGW